MNEWPEFDSSAAPRSAHMTDTDQFRVLECGTIVVESAERDYDANKRGGDLGGAFAIGLIVLLISVCSVCQIKEASIMPVRNKEQHRIGRIGMQSAMSAKCIRRWKGSSSRIPASTCLSTHGFPRSDKALRTQT